MVILVHRVSTTRVYQSLIDFLLIRAYRLISAQDNLRISEFADSVPFLWMRIFPSLILAREVDESIGWGLELFPLAYRFQG